MDLLKNGSLDDKVESHIVRPVKCLNMNLKGGREGSIFQNFAEENEMRLSPQICWIFRLYDVNRDGAVCISDIEQITSAIFYIISEKDDVLVRNQISDRVDFISKVDFNLGNE